MKVIHMEVFQMTDMANSIPGLPDLFVMDPDGATLIGGRCTACNTYFFPFYNEQHKPGCGRKVEKIPFDRKGILRSYAVQYYQAPLPFRTEGKIAPYIIGLVEFHGAIQVAGIVTGCKADDLSLGMEMTTTTFELYKNEEGKKVVTWAFRPL